jgi:hypothetical protein
MDKMDILDNTHTCLHCQKIELDGTGLYVEQRFEFSSDNVKVFAADCLLFNWCLLQAGVDPEPTDRLVLSTGADSEDVAYLDVCWEHEFGQPLSTDYFCDHTSLHIFADKGTSCLFK